ncbi:MAG: class I SAM-dependent methyltransferase [Bradymonadia bacterium]
MYIASTITQRMTSEQLQPYADWFGLRVHTHRPLPKDEVGFVLQGGKVRLECPGRKAQLWHPGLAYRRIKHDSDALRHVLEVREGTHVLDCTLGMGHDALALRAAGARVTSLERLAPMILYTMTGAWHFAPELARGLHIIRTTYQEFLAQASTNAFDHVYLDPMFPRSEGYEGRNVTWSLMRTFTETEPRFVPEVLRDAFRVARKSVAVKLAPRENVEPIDGMPQAEIVGSKRQRYARWQTKEH